MPSRKFSPITVTAVALEDSPVLGRNLTRLGSGAKRKRVLESGKSIPLLDTCKTVLPGSNLGVVQVSTELLTHAAFTFRIFPKRQARSC
eukprot:836621-Rhodomonas_salina.2